MAATLSAIAIDPPSGKISVAATIVFTATEVRSDSVDKIPATDARFVPVTWSSSDPSVATVDASGNAKGLRIGTTNIVATEPVSGLSATATLTVSSATLARLEIEPTTASTPKGRSQPFTATAIFSDNTKLDVTKTVAWSSKTPTVATIEPTGIATGVAVGSTEIVATDTASKISGTAKLTVTDAQLTSLEVTPVTKTIPNGTTQAFVATGRFTDGTTKDLTASVDWAPATPAVASISTAGLAKGLSAGTTKITATDKLTKVSGSASLTVSDAVLVSIAVTPATDSIPNGTTETYTATGTFSDGTTKDLTSTTTWTSDTPTVATIAPTGIATAIDAGTTVIKATDATSGIFGTATLTVTSAVLVSIEVTPANPSTAKGTKQAFVATGTFSDKSTRPITETVTWSSSDATATISNAPGTEGIASAVDAGTPTITATDPTTGKSASTVLTITAATLVKISVTPANLTLAAGLPQQYVATGVYTDGSNQNLTQSVTWDVSAASVATISNAAGSRGLAMTKSSGSTFVMALMPGTTPAIGGQTILRVTGATLVGLQIAPTNPSVALGNGQQFTATGFYTNGSSTNLTAQVTWTSGTPSVATISNAVGTQGLASSLTATPTTGTTTISAAMPGTPFTASTTLTVTSAVLKSLQISPTDPSVAKGRTQPFVATGIYSDNSKATVTTQVTWASANSNVIISNAGGSEGVAKAAVVGSSTITASMPGTAISASTLMTVTSAVITSIEVSPADAKLANGLTLQYTAQAIYSDNTNSDVTTQVTWESSTANATISTAVGSKGLATAELVGPTVIKATLDTISGSTGLTVTAATISLIQVTPTTPNLPNGQTLQFTATGIYTDATQSDITDQVTWDSSTTKATISNAPKGLATAQSVGTTEISASLNGKTGSTTLTVTPAVLTAIQVDPGEASSAAGTTRPYMATGQYSDGSSANITTSVTWTPSNAAICTIDPDGVATAKSLGDCTITASVVSPVISGTALLHVTAATLQTIEVTPPDPKVAKGVQQQFAATGHYTDNTVQDLTTQVTWSSTDTTVVTIENSATFEGLASTKAIGTATVKATLGTVVGFTGITVTAATLLRIEVSPSSPTTPTRSQEEFSATAVYSDNTTIDVTSSVTWASSNTGIASISNDSTAGTEGIASTTSTAGTTTIKATDPVSGLSGSTVMTTVVALITSITVTPANATVPKGVRVKYKAVATYDIPLTRDVTQYVSWNSSAPGTVGIGNSPRRRGIANTKKVGSVTITATDSVSGVSGSTGLTVSSAPLTAITVTPASSTIPNGTKQQFTAVGSYFNGTTTDLIDITALVTWSSSNTGAATISNTTQTPGFASTNGVGSTTISAIDPTTPAITGSTTLTVSGATLVSLAITPASPSIFVSDKLQLTATATFNDLSTKDVTKEVAWSSANTAIATVANQQAIKGSLTGIAGGSTTVSAAYPQTTISTTANVTIKP